MSRHTRVLSSAWAERRAADYRANREGVTLPDSPMRRGMTTLEAVQSGIPRWMALAMPEDCDSIVTMARLQYHHPALIRAAIEYGVRLLRWGQWERRPTHKPTRPRCLRPSLIRRYEERWAAGDRRGSNLTPERASEIGRLSPTKIRIGQGRKMNALRKNRRGWPKGQKRWN